MDTDADGREARLTFCDVLMRDMRKGSPTPDNGLQRHVCGKERHALKVRIHVLIVWLRYLSITVLTEHSPAPRSHVSSVVNSAMVSLRQATKGGINLEMSVHAPVWPCAHDFSYSEDSLRGMETPRRSMGTP